MGFLDLIGRGGAGGVPSGMPGVAETEHGPDPALLTMPQAARAIGQAEVDKALETLKKYKEGKINLEQRIIEDEQWYKLRHWEYLRRKNAGEDPEPASAWLFNSLANKHADAMDNYPEPNVLPRERSDEEDAKTLSSILPVVMERCEFEQTYSDNWWKKLKDGSSVYGVFWDKSAENGLGDISIQKVDLLNLFWEPGQSDIQQSRNVFLVSLVDMDLLEGEYPQLSGKLSADTLDVGKYIYDDTVDTSEKTVVVDWYYKSRSASGGTLLHYAKIAGGKLLFASENDPNYTERGWYDHGKYPFVFDTMYPLEGSPCGFGVIAVARDPQLYIDKLSSNLLKSTMMATRPRYFVSASSGINEEEFLDWSKPIIHVEGTLEESRVRPVEVGTMTASAINVLQMKIDELKETTANRDVSQGSSGKGVTAAAAIAALQEAGNKGSRDIIAAAYRAYTKINYLCIELIRQFYDETRSFRITGDVPGEYQFVDYSNAGLRDQPLGPDTQGGTMVRKPIFDIKIKAQKRSPFSRMSQNELAKELYGTGFFNPERAQEALGALELMEFEGKDKVMEQVRQGQTLLNVCQQMAGQMDQMAALIQASTGMDMGMAGQQGGPTGQAKPGPGGRADMPTGGLASAAQQAQRTAMTDYGQRLAARAAPDMGRQSGVSVG